MRKNRVTDWDKYYSGKKSFFSSHTQKYTLKYIRDSIARYGIDNISVLECGGGNSCFAKQLCEADIRIKKYDIIDNNLYSVNLFNKNDISVAHEGKCIDLTDECMGKDIAQYDFVFSIGLIEHFTEANREKVIDAHFQFCKPGGIVYISFPTPTLKYRICRKFMELIHVWQFWDETPLRSEEVMPVIERNGSIVDSFMNKKLPLSQYILVARKSY